MRRYSWETSSGSRRSQPSASMIGLIRLALVFCSPSRPGFRWKRSSRSAHCLTASRRFSTFTPVCHVGRRIRRAVVGGPGRRGESARRFSRRTASRGRWHPRASLSRRGCRTSRTCRTTAARPRCSAGPAPLDLHRPHSAGDDQHVVGLAGTVAVAADDDPQFVHIGRTVWQRLLARHAGRLFSASRNGATVRPSCAPP